MKLQAFRGVSAEYPENTLTALVAAQEQGYEAFAVDVTATADGALVLCAQQTLDRLARKADATQPDKSLVLSDMRYEDLLAYDFGVVWGRKYQDTPVCVLREALQLAKRAGMEVEIRPHDMSAAHMQKLYALVESYGASAGLCFADADMLLQAYQQLPRTAMYYDGPVTEAVLQKLAEVKGLTVWLAADAPDSLACHVAGIARLGMGPAAEYDQLERAERLGAQIVSTTGSLKNPMRTGVLADMHVHSQNSHDAFTPIEELCRSNMAAGVSIVNIADHCDLFLCDDDPGLDVYSNLLDAYEEIRQVNGALGSDCKVLLGVEMGEELWYPVQCTKVRKTVPFDCILGSVHALHCKWNENAHGMDIAYSHFDWENMTLAQSQEIFAQYFEDLLKMVQVADIDVVAHLTTVTTYYIRKKKAVVDLRCYEPIIRQILQVIIDRRLALEVNTGSYGVFGITRPEEWILKLYRQMGGYLITMGTDSHDTRSVAVGYPEVVNMLKRLGFRHTFYFEKRRSYQLTL